MNVTEIEIVKEREIETATGTEIVLDVAINIIDHIEIDHVIDPKKDAVAAKVAVRPVWIVVVMVRRQYLLVNRQVIIMMINNQVPANTIIVAVDTRQN